jgi:hypothetical protein
VSSYASLTDAENFGLIPGAFGLNITAGQIQANLDARSDWADTRMAARYSMPILAPYPASLVMAVVHMARYDILALRGFDEANAADKIVIQSFERAEKLLNDVQRQQAHFVGIKESPPPTSTPQPSYAAPLVMSQPLQGWIPSEGCGPNPGPTPTPFWYPGCGWNQGGGSGVIS